MYQIIVNTKSGGHYSAKPKDMPFEPFDTNAKRLVESLNNTMYLRVESEVGGVDYVLTTEVESITVYDVIANEGMF